MYFIASRHLWEAPSSIQFYRSWREKPQFCIDGMSFKEAWQYARPDDLDEFSKLMMTTWVLCFFSSRPLLTRL